MGKVMSYIKNPWKTFEFLNNRQLFNWMPDKLFLKLAYRCNIRKKLNLENPQTYTEKLQWLKLYDRNSKYTMLVDKYEVKKYVTEKLGKEYVIPTLGVWNSFDEIDFDKLPNQFVLKCTHDSGGVVICKDKSYFDKTAARKKITKSLKRDYYLTRREWPYKNVKRRIIAEQFIEDKSGTGMKDYKFFCFNGEVKHVLVCSNREVDLHVDIFDANFNHQDIISGHSNADIVIPKPKGFEKMKHLASKLSVGLCQARIDFYDIEGKIYFGEITFFHWGGLVKFEPDKWDYIFGKYIQLPNN